MLSQATKWLCFLSDPGVPRVRSMGPVVTKWVRHLVEELTDMTLADGDFKSILTDTANSPIQGNMAMQNLQLMHVTLVVKFGTNASVAICWPNL